MGERDVSEGERRGAEEMEKTVMSVVGDGRP
jgi:hypothetical protein